MNSPFSKSQFALFFDTETTGFISGKQHLSHGCQPHVVQLAATLVHLETREVAQSIDLICKPDNWTISQGAADTHGITQEIATELGIDESAALHIFFDMWNRSKFAVAHNFQFDRQIIMSGFYRFLGDTIADHWWAGKSYCTMNEASSIVKCPPTAKMVAAGRNHIKPPNLGEAYKFFTGNDIVNAHSAMADVRATMDVYWGIQDHGKQNAA